MEYRFSTDKPIYAQLVDKFKSSIISGELQPGSKLQSVRDLAIEAGVNPNTMQKALTELERLCLIKTERTSGKFITNDLELISVMRYDVADKEVNIFLEKMSSLGFDITKTIQMIEGKDK